MFQIPPWWLKLHSGAELELAMEYRLSTRDAARMLGVTEAHVRYHCREHEGATWLPLKHRTFGASPARAFRLHDVLEFAKRHGWHVELAAVPAVLRAEWNIELQLDAIEQHDYAETNEGGTND
jgi:transposase